jgi:hypothetical protein
VSWTTPLTAVSNAALTSAQWNASVRDNLAQTAPALATTAGRFMATTGANAIAERIPNSTNVAAFETSAITSYGAITTAGPAVTATTGPWALVAYGANISNDTTGANMLMSYSISGATTLAAADTQGLGLTQTGANRTFLCSRVLLQAVTAGSNVFTCLYRVSGGTGSWGNRHLAIVPF